MNQKYRIMVFCLRDILHEKQISIAQLSSKCGISASKLSNYMSGKISPTLDTLNKIADALDIGITELFKKREEVVLMAKYEGKTIEIDTEDLINYIKTREIANEQSEGNK